MYQLLKPLVFKLSAEKAHHFTTKAFDTLCAIPGVSNVITSLFKFEKSNLEKELFGLKFKNPVGLAAGFDKDGKYMRPMSKLGFGFLELGTVTPRSQVGNPKPRLFRLIEDQAVINRMGFNNEGVDFLVEKLKNYKKGDLIIGGNIGKNKDTPNAEAYKDYEICFKKLYNYVDYFVVNLSSPNTPGLRELQDKEPLRHLLSVLINYKKEQAVSRPILLKIAPDLSDEQLKDVVEIVEELNIDGIIAANTTIARSPLMASKEEIEKIGAGGLSGAPVAEKSTAIIKKIATLSDGRIPIIGVGGINSGASAQSKIDAGASLVQIYSGMVYEGPFLVKRIKRYLSKSM